MAFIRERSPAARRILLPQRMRAQAPKTAYVHPPQRGAAVVAGTLSSPRANRFCSACGATNAWRAARSGKCNETLPPWCFRCYADITPTARRFPRCARSRFYAGDRMLFCERQANGKSASYRRTCFSTAVASRDSSTRPRDLPELSSDCFARASALVAPCAHHRRGNAAHRQPRQPRRMCVSRAVSGNRTCRSTC